MLVWRRATRARYYNVQVYRETMVRGRPTLIKIHSAWPDRARHTLPTRWTYGGKQRGIGAGRYHWYVWPGFGAKSAVDYGGLLGWTSFTVD